MCSLSAEDCEESTTTRESAPGIEARATTLVCRKCGDPELETRTEYCRGCFSKVVTHKFRAAIGKARKTRGCESVLVGHSGRANSTVLLHLLEAARSESLGKRINFVCKFLYIDEAAAEGWSSQQRDSVLKAMAQDAKTFSVPGYTVPLSLEENISDEGIQGVEEPRADTTRQDANLSLVLEALRSDTAREDLTRHLRRRILVSAARKLGCDKILLANTSLDLAISILGDVATGRGAQQLGGLFIEPLREFTSNELRVYSEIHGLLASRLAVPDGGSVRSTARRFVEGLDAEFRGTVSTINRTSEKLAGRGTMLEDERICALCQAVLEDCSSKRGLSALDAKRFSEAVSLDPTRESEEERKNLCCCDTTAKSMENLLCYACKLIFSESTRLPGFAIDAICEEARLSSARREIANFLL